jgi:ribosomal protein L21E
MIMDTDLKVGDKISLKPERFATNGDAHVYTHGATGTIVRFEKGRKHNCPIVLMDRDSKGVKNVEIHIPSDLIEVLVLQPQ